MTRSNSIDWKAQSEPDKNPKFKRKWQKPFRLRDYQADSILKLLEQARVACLEGRSEKANHFIAQARQSITEARDSHHQYLRREADYDRP